MPGIEEVLERLVTDPRFREALQRDAQAALSGYDLSDDDRRLLDAQLSASAGASGAVEQRTSKSSLSGLFDVGSGDTTGGWYREEPTLSLGGADDTAEMKEGPSTSEGSRKPGSTTAQRPPRAGRWRTSS